MLWIKSIIHLNVTSCSGSSRAYSWKVTETMTIRKSTSTIQMTPNIIIIGRRTGL